MRWQRPDGDHGSPGANGNFGTAYCSAPGNFGTTYCGADSNFGTAYCSAHGHTETCHGDSGAAHGDSQPASRGVRKQLERVVRHPGQSRHQGKLPAA